MIGKHFNSRRRLFKQADFGTASHVLAVSLDLDKQARPYV